MHLMSTLPIFLDHCLLWRTYTLRFFTLVFVLCRLSWPYASYSQSPSVTITSSNLLTCEQPSTTLTAATSCTGTMRYAFKGPYDFELINTTGEARVTMSGSYSVTATDATGHCTGNATIDIVTTLHPDYLPLVNLYNSTKGDSWINHSGWLSNCDPCSGWFGVNCTEGRVTELNLGNPANRTQGNNLDGPFPQTVGGLIKLRKLIVSFNNKLTGPIPGSLGQLPDLQYVDLFSNNFGGSIPASLGELAKVEVFYLGFNGLTGTIPTSLGGLKSIKDMHLGSNGLTGPIPSSFRQLKTLQRLALSGNRLSGSIPDYFNEFPTLSELYLTINQFTGSIPASLGTVKSLAILSLAVNQLSGCIPVSLKNLCGRRIEINGNAGLPGGGDWASFCTSGTGEYSGNLTTTKSGYWHDQTVWSCGALPQFGDQVLLQHTLTIKSGESSQAGYLRYINDGKLIYEAGGQLLINP